MLTKTDVIMVNVAELDEEFIPCVSITTTVNLRVYKSMTLADALKYAKNFSFKGIKYKLNNGTYEYYYVN